MEPTTSPQFDVCRMDYRAFASSDFYKPFYPDNKGGMFKCPKPYLKEVTSAYSVALVGHHFTPGFHNVIKDQAVYWMKTTNNVKYFVVGKGYIKAGYYPTPMHLTMEIVNLVFSLNSTLPKPYKTNELPLLEYVDDGYVTLKSEPHYQGDQKWNMVLKLSRPVAKLLGCTPSGDCKVAHGRRWDRLSHVEPGVAVAIEKPNMRPPYSQLHLRSNMCSEDLMVFRVKDLSYGVVEHVNPQYIPVKDLEGDHLQFYFVNGRGEIVNKEGSTALTLSFKATKCVQDTDDEDTGTIMEKE